MEKNVALIVVDLQNDFCPGGSLAVKDGDAIVPIVNDLLPLFKTVIFTKDWHPADCKSFASQHDGFDPFSLKDGCTLWPDHCIQDTPGADLHSGILFGQIFGDFYIFKKGLDKNYHPYSGFDGTGLTEFLRKRDIDTVYIVGLATDYCCLATALDAAARGFSTNFVLDATRGINPDTTPTVFSLESANINVLNSGDLLWKNGK